MTACGLKHASWDVPPDKWRCPKCGARDEFSIEMPEDDESCELLHADDGCACTKCGYIGSGEQVARALKKLEKPDPHIAYLQGLIDPSSGASKTDVKIIKQIIKRLEKSP